ncbi:hypothetical protein COU61_01670 [Candidatus Pacearchaeota archaeon CG10_big_fil_rev_8_21_14_0_10_35_13]|nr:MAG: hypothetical protein COU61_01670 [Candidatus Pacearchaeota archaeon CG10_big_fil_rev_8_21_14_0_10_35_13]
MEKVKVLGIIFGMIIIISDIIWLMGNKVFYLLLGVGVTIGALPFVVLTIIETDKEKNLERMFLEFSRNLVESVNSGTPISKSIINLRGKDYEELTPYINKLANQISIGIPLQKALITLARETNSGVIRRAVTQIGEAERAGGDIGKILESVARTVSEVEKLKKERKAKIYNLVVQGYIIFFVFIAIILVMQYRILPLTSEITGYGGQIGDIGTKPIDTDIITTMFLGLIITQGFFTGIVIGKLSEGSAKAGIKHSFILVAISFLILTGTGAVL